MQNTFSDLSKQIQSFFSTSDIFERLSLTYIWAIIERLSEKSVKNMFFFKIIIRLKRGMLRDGWAIHVFN